MELPSNMIEVASGSIFDIKADVYVNPVNCVGTMGAGLAKQFWDKFPAMRKPYMSLCERKVIKPGRPEPIPVGGLRPYAGIQVCLFPTKDHWKNPSKIEWIRDGLAWCAKQKSYQSFGDEKQTWAFPLLGCGLGGLTIDVIVPLMMDGLKDAHFNWVLAVTKNDEARVQAVLASMILRDYNPHQDTLKSLEGFHKPQ